jgi:hypothetical protein
MGKRKSNGTGDLFTDGIIGQTRQAVMKKAEEKDGCKCDVCGQLVKVYSRAITSTMARQLIHADAIHGDRFFHIKDVVMGQSGASDFSKLHYWGLITAAPHDLSDKTKKTSGFWRITDTGRAFIRGGLSLPKYALVYNGEFLGFDNAKGVATIRDALGNKFDYSALMRESVTPGALAAVQ